MDGTKITNEFRACMTALQKAKSNYDNKCKDADTAQQAFQKARSDGNIKPKKLNEVRSPCKLCNSCTSTLSLASSWLLSPPSLAAVSSREIGNASLCLDRRHCCSLS